MKLKIEFPRVLYFQPLISKWQQPNPFFAKTVASKGQMIGKWPHVRMEIPMEKSSKKKKLENGSWKPNQETKN